MSSRINDLKANIGQLGQGSEVLIPFLSDMVDVMGELVETMQKMIPEGRIRSTTITVNDTPRLLGETDWFSATLYNEGPDDFYIFDQHQTPRVGFDGAIKPGRSIFIDCRSKTGKPKYIVCAAGKTCEVTVFRMW